MSFEDIKERLTSDAQQTWERLQESSAYNQLRDRYENMTPSMQKLSIVGVAAFLSFIVLSIPYGNFSESQDYVAEFESKRSTIRELQKVSRESSEVPHLSTAPPLSELKTLIEGQLQGAKLLPEQIKGTRITESNSPLIPKNLTDGMLEVTLEKLNINQILDIGYQFQNINPSVKVKDMAMSANRSDSRYFDVIFKMVTLAVPAPPVVAAEPTNTRGGRGGRGN